MKELKVGDVIYSYQYGAVTGKRTIDRVTSKRAYSGDIQFKKEYDGNMLNEIGVGTWRTYSYFIENEKMAKEWGRRLLIRKVKEKVNDVTQYSTEKLTQLLELLSN